MAIGLASGFSKLSDGEEEYYFLTYQGDSRWLRPYVSGAAKIVESVSTAKMARLRRVLMAHIPRLRRLSVLEHSIAAQLAGLPRPDRQVERLNPAVIHFTTPAGFRTQIPSIYHPHDLQHVHLPQFFDPITRAVRDQRYRKLCEQATVVAVVSSWVKRDLIDQYGLCSEKIAVIPFAPPLAAYESPSVYDIRNAVQKFALPRDFAFYPAQTWPHKNHLALLEAIALLRKRDGLEVPLVCTGYQNEFFSTIRRKAMELELDASVKFLGVVNSVDLQCLYRLSRCTVIPSLFEAASFPVWEAFMAGSPVVCSRVTSLPSQIGDAGLLFDPHDPSDIARCVARLWQNNELRRTLVDKASRNIARFTWEKTATRFRAYYRLVARRRLSDEDRAILGEEPAL